MSRITDQPRKVCELADFYGVSTRTFNKWLKCKSLRHVLAKKEGHFFQIPELIEIIEHLGEPAMGEVFTI